MSDEKITTHENSLTRMVDAAVRRLEARGFFRDEPPKKRSFQLRGVAKRNSRHRKSDIANKGSKQTT